MKNLILLLAITLGLTASAQNKYEWVASGGAAGILAVNDSKVCLSVTMTSMGMALALGGDNIQDGDRLIILFDSDTTLGFETTCPRSNSDVTIVEWDLKSRGWFKYLKTGETVTIASVDSLDNIIEAYVFKLAGSSAALNQVY